jgi:esterase/lipase
MSRLSWGDLEKMSNTHVHHHFYHHSEEYIIMKIAELLEAQASVKNQLNKAEAEIIAKISTLQDAIAALTDQLANLNLPDEVVQSLNDLQAASQSLDDVVADETPVEEEPAA